MMSKAIIKKASIVFTGNVLSQLFALTFMILATRILTKEDYGYVSYIISMGAFFGVFVAGGFPIALTRYIAKEPEREKAYIRNALFGILVLFTVVSIIAAVLFWPHVEIIAIIFTSSTVGFYLGVLKGRRDFNLYAILNSGRNFIKLLVLSILILMGVVSKYNVIWTYAIAGLTMILIVEYFFRLKVLVIPKYEKEIFNTLLKFSLPLMITTIFYSLTNNAGIYILHSELGNSAVASYKNALVLLMVYGFVSGAVGTVLFPKISSTKEPKIIMKNLRDSIIFTLTIEILLFIAALAVGKPLIVLLLSDKYTDVFPLFILMSLGFFASTVRNMFSAFWEGTGRPVISMIDMLIAGSSITLFTLVLVPIYGLIGAAYSYSIGFALAALTDFIFFIFYRHRGDFTAERIHK